VVSYGLANPVLRRVVLCCNMLCCVAACRAAVPGGIGWLMVKSGLEKPKHEGQDIHVSPYRSARTCLLQDRLDCHTFSAALTAVAWRMAHSGTCVLPAMPAAPHCMPLPHYRRSSLCLIWAALSTTAVTLGLPVPPPLRALLNPDDTVYCTANRCGLGCPMMRSLTQSHAVALCFWVGSAHPNEPHRTATALSRALRVVGLLLNSGSRRTCRARL
jgi:hypothetical protein